MSNFCSESGVSANGGYLQECLGKKHVLYTFCTSCGKPTPIIPSLYRRPKCEAFVRYEED